MSAIIKLVAIGRADDEEKLITRDVVSLWDHTIDAMTGSTFSFSVRLSPNGHDMVNVPGRNLLDLDKDMFGVARVDEPIYTHTFQPRAEMCEKEYSTFNFSRID
jgi:hypothetical protein